MLTFILSLLLIGLYLLWRGSQSRMRRIHECADKVPGPKPLPILGNALEFGLSNKSIFEYLLKRVPKEYGGVSRLWIGSRLLLVLADPVSVELLLNNKQYVAKSSRYKLMKQFFGEGVLVSEGEIWKRHRKIIAPTFKGKILEQFVGSFNSTTDTLISLLRHYQNGSDFDICPLLNLYTLDIICESAIGVKANAMLQSDSQYVKAVNGLEVLFYKRITRPWLNSDIIYNLTPNGRLCAKYLSIVHGMVRRIIKERKQTSAAEQLTNVDVQKEDEATGYRKKTAFLDHLLHYVENGAQLTDQEIQDNVQTIMAAGHDTTAACLSFTCWLLSKHPHIQEKAIEELRTIFGDSMRHATVQDLNEMIYLEQILKESLRLLPAIPMFGRAPSEDINTGKYTFPAGCDICVNVYMLHRHPDYFPDPEKFDPDRFLPENCAARHPYCYLPFAGGPRMCLGNKYAFYEMKIAMTQILRHFKILPADNPFQDLDLAIQVVLKSLNGVRIRLQPRNFASGH